MHEYNFNIRQNENVNYIDYTRHYSSGEPMQEEQTDYDIPPKQYKSIRFNKETHPLSLMVYWHAYNVMYVCYCKSNFFIERLNTSKTGFLHIL